MFKCCLYKHIGIVSFSSVSAFDIESNMGDFVFFVLVNIVKEILIHLSL